MLDTGDHLLPGLDLGGPTAPTRAEAGPPGGLHGVEERDVLVARPAGRARRAAEDTRRPHAVVERSFGRQVTVEDRLPAGVLVSVQITVSMHGVVPRAFP